MKRMLLIMVALTLSLAGCSGDTSGTSDAQQGQLDSYSQQLADMQEQLADMMIADYQSQINALVAGEAEAAAKISALVDSTAATVTDIASARTAIIDMQASVADIIRNYATKAAVDALQRQATAISATVLAHGDTIAGISAQMVQIQAQIAAIQSGHDADIEMLQAQINTLTGVLQHLGYIQLSGAGTAITFTKTVVSETQMNVVAHTGAGNAGGVATFALFQRTGGDISNATLESSIVRVDNVGDVAVNVQNMTPNVEYLVVMSVAPEGINSTSAHVMAASTPMVATSASVSISIAAPVWTQTATTADPANTVEQLSVGTAGTYAVVQIGAYPSIVSRLERRDPATGAVMWSVDKATGTNAGWVATAQGAGADVYFGDPSTGQVSKINVATGANDWTKGPFGGPAIAVADGLIVSGGPNLTKLDTAGNILWTYNNNDRTIANMASSDGIYITWISGSDGSLQVTKINSTSGTWLWTKTVIAAETAGSYLAADAQGAYVLYWGTGISFRVSHYNTDGTFDKTRLLSSQGMSPTAYTQVAAYNGSIYMSEISVVALPGGWPRYAVYGLDIVSGNDKFLSVPVALLNSGSVRGLSVYLGQVCYSIGTSMMCYNSL